MLQPLSKEEQNILHQAFHAAGVTDVNNPIHALTALLSQANVMRNSAIKVKSIMKADELIESKPDDILLFMLTKKGTTWLDIAVPLTGTDSMLSVSAHPYVENPEFSEHIASIHYVSKEYDYSLITSCSQYEPNQKPGGFEAVFYGDVNSEEFTQKLNISTVKEYNKTFEFEEQ